MGRVINISARLSRKSGAGLSIQRPRQQPVAYYIDELPYGALPLPIRPARRAQSYSHEED